ncbi:fructokinase [Ktedonobacter sp. SOSP1-85]|uniref:carbohydrate kinase family protein n=1 Tax=Ktedonobacter sp. SOSP1-85 TaxID=2778367 RepID=UPI0019169B89|nr:carbohydrate kinase [Ktedonobacter sp. SOSP1-85]GHO81195.1 fructokinase [Ktedonobacter sp. SOSP1-85]
MRRLITCVGECLIDFMPLREGQHSLGYGVDFRMYAGGSIFNVAVALARLEQPTAFACKVADDYFGQYLRTYMQREQIDTRFLVEAPGTHTTLAFVAEQDGHPTFSFYGEGAADALLMANEIPEALYIETRILHFGSISLLRGSTPQAVLYILEKLRGKALLSFDPNLRPNLVQDERAYRELLRRAFSLADIVKCSDADLEWIYPGLGNEEALAELLRQGPALAVITQGGQGAIAARIGGPVVRVPVFPVEITDTVGAGDSFCAGLLARLSELGIDERARLKSLTPEQLSQVLRFASGVSALNCTRTGANAPQRAEVEAFLRKA